MRVKITQDDWYCADFSNYKNSPEYKMNLFKVLFCKFAKWMFGISQKFFHQAMDTPEKRKSEMERKLERRAKATSRLEELTVDFDYEENHERQSNQA